MPALRSRFATFLLPLRGFLGELLGGVLKFSNRVLFCLRLNCCATAFAEEIEFSRCLFVRRFARHRTGIRKHPSFVEPEEFVEFGLPIGEENLFAALGLVFGEVKEHDDDTIQLFDLAFTQVVLGGTQHGADQLERCRRP